ncbi:MAG: NYN domain-containing protein [Planctomycetaceae bacterium]
MRFDTAIFYDIENLIGGYGARMDYISELSLKDILEEIRKVDILGGIAVQRAYANWSDPRLNVMRGDIVDLGIEPIQMFGFGKGTAKNASDIQLAIDAVDCAISRPSIETFVIVSGDGGFSALAKKLHEYGKAVVGCAYRRTTNRVFEAVCDRFVWIAQSGGDEVQRSTGVATVATDPLLREFGAKVSPMAAKSPADIVQKARAILERLAASRDGQYLLKSTGMNISIAAQALSMGIKDFSFVKSGFTKLVDFLRHVVHGSKLALLHHPPSDYRLVMAGTSVNGFRMVSTVAELPSIHTEENYRTLLATDNPIFRLPPHDALVRVASFLVGETDSIHRLPLGDIIGSVTESCEVEQRHAKEAVLAFVSAGAFARVPEDARLSEQMLTLRKHSLEVLMKTLCDAVRTKLSSAVGDIDEGVFLQIMK